MKTSQAQRMVLHYMNTGWVLHYDIYGTPKAYLLKQGRHKTIQPTVIDSLLAKHLIQEAGEVEGEEYHYTYQLTPSGLQEAQ